MTNVTDANNIFEITAAVNGLSNGLFAAFLLSVVFLISFVAMKNYDTKSVFITSSFITSVIGAILFFLNMISLSIAMLPLLALAIAIFVKVFTEG